MKQVVSILYHWPVYLFAYTYIFSDCKSKLYDF